MCSKRKIAVFTSIRSEFEALVPLLRIIDREPSLELLLMAGGAHLGSEMGHTLRLIGEAGFRPAVLLNFMYDDGVMISPGMQIARLAEQSTAFFSQNRPDLLVLGGDRYELLGIATAALVMNIPIAHIGGGDITTGAIDNQVRNAVSKMAHLHFTGTASSMKNLVKMGEEQWRITVAGELMLDRIMETVPADMDELCRETRLEPGNPFIMATFHPDTIAGEITGSYVTDLFTRIISTLHCSILATSSNPDPGGDDINRALAALNSRHPVFCHVPTLGSRLYYSAMKHASVILGNSSGPLIEAQSFHKPVVNVGKRQGGRKANPGVINTPADPESVINAIGEALSPAFRPRLIKPNIFGDGHAAARIAGVILKCDPETLLIKK